MVQSRRTVPGRLGHKASPPTSEGIASVAFSPSHLRYRQRQRPSPRQSLRISGAHRYGRRQRRRWRRRRTAFRRSSRRSHRRLGTSDRPRAHNTSPPVSDAIAPATFSPSHIRHRQRQHPSPRRSLRISGAHRYRRRQSRRWRRRRTAFRRSSRRSHRRLGTSDRSRGQPLPAGTSHPRGTSKSTRPTTCRQPAAWTWTAARACLRRSSGARVVSASAPQGSSSSSRPPAIHT
mmetsp:Transcript_135663/g.433985  ORF Transcript_135663/g.433985 Transcript_135663/m.433985 type:complete len:233 (+) Transcript_135663:120-818(+)